MAGALGAVKAVSDGIVDNAFCAIRPPGHHAHNSGGEEGFCYFNNVAIAAKYAQNVLNYEKILIIDWDYHHGNATQDSFYSDPSVLFFSTHNQFAYPGTGDPAMQGEGAGLGYNINAHLDTGATDDDMKRAWEEQLLPKVETFKPDFVLISAGFDSRKDDTLGTFTITDSCFSYITKLALDIADTYCKGRLVSLLEGGYNIGGLALAVEAHISTLLTGTVGIAKHLKSDRVSDCYIKNSILYLPSERRSIEYITITDSSGIIIKKITPSLIKKGKVDLKQFNFAGGYYLITIRFTNHVSRTFRFFITK